MVLWAHTTASPSVRLARLAMVSDVVVEAAALPRGSFLPVSALPRQSAALSRTQTKCLGLGSVSYSLRDDMAQN